MFGPNMRPSMHHRQNNYRALVADTQILFRKIFGISEEYDILFLPGSGTIALEAVILSVVSTDYGARVADTAHEFGMRTKKLLCAHDRYCPSSDIVFSVQYETLAGKLMPYKHLGSINIVDCISSFPYYAPPQCDVWITVAGKQLGCSPGIAIVVIRRALLDTINRNRYSALNLSRYANVNIPHTPAIGLMVELHDKLAAQDILWAERIRAIINANRQALHEFFDDRTIGPVFNIDVQIARHLGIADKFDLYVKHSTAQIYLYHDLSSLIQELRNNGRGLSN